MAWRGSVGATTNTGSATFAITVSGLGGTGPQLNDIVLLSGVASDTSGAAYTMSCPGFTLATASTLLTSSNCTQFVLYKIATGSEPSSYTITASGTGSPAATWAAQCNCFTGRNTTSPITTASTAPSVFTGTPLSIVCPTITPAAGDDLLWLGNVGTNLTNTSTLTPPSGFANTLDTSVATTNTPGTHSCNLLSAAGTATGSVTGSIAFTGGANNDGAGFLISIAQSGFIPPPAVPAQGPMPRRKFILP